MRRVKCCYNCENYNDGLCDITDIYDDEDPTICSCAVYVEVKESEEL